MQAITIKTYITLGYVFVSIFVSGCASLINDCQNSIDSIAFSQHIYHCKELARIKQKHNVGTVATPQYVEIDIGINSSEYEMCMKDANYGVVKISMPVNREGVQ